MQPIFVARLYRYLYVSKTTSVIKTEKVKQKYRSVSFKSVCVHLCPLFDISDSQLNISSTKYVCFCSTAGFVRLLPSSVCSVIWITGGETPFSPNTLEPTLQYITEIGHDNRHLFKSSIIFVRLTLTSLSPIQCHEDERDLEAFSPLSISLSNHFPCVCDPPDANTCTLQMEK